VLPFGGYASKSFYDLPSLLFVFAFSFRLSAFRSGGLVISLGDERKSLGT
jgi:hypothetical protein